MFNSNWLKMQSLARRVAVLFKEWLENLKSTDEGEGCYFDPNSLHNNETVSWNRF